MTGNRVGYLQLGSGVSGDMLLGALVGAGASLEVMEHAVRAAAGERVGLVARRVTRAGLAAIQVAVHVDGKAVVEGESDPHGHSPGDEHPHEHSQGHAHPHDPAHPPGSAGSPASATPYPDLDARLAAAALDAPVRDAARAVFLELARAEASSHGRSLETVHFHEVGALDAIADVVGVAAGIHDLGLTRIWHGPVAVGGGSARMAHGRLPVPAPATVVLLAGRPLVLEEGLGELATPTGAALLRVFTEPASGPISFVPSGTGVGAGSRDVSDRPNVVRLIVGAAAPEGAIRRNRVAVIEAALDDSTPEDGGDLIHRLLAAGALDVSLTPTMMKKGRPGFLLRVLVPEEGGAAFAARILEESTSLGARWRVEERVELPRREERVRLPQGEVRVKIAELPGGEERLHAEYEDLRALADASGIPLHRLRRQVEAVWESTR